MSPLLIAFLRPPSVGRLRPVASTCQSVFAAHNSEQDEGCFATMRRQYNSAINIVITPDGGQQHSSEAKKGKTNKSSKHRKQRGQASYKFVDRARIRVAGGSGGNGSLSNKSLGKYKRRPDGGHGGNGGHVILVADSNEQTLGMSVHHHAAEDGKPGSGNQMHGRSGRNKIIRVPCGVVVRRVLDHDEVWDEEEKVVRKPESFDVDRAEEEDMGYDYYKGDSGNELNRWEEDGSPLDDDGGHDSAPESHDERGEYTDSVEEEETDEETDSDEEPDLEYGLDEGSDSDDENFDKTDHQPLGCESIANTGIKGEDGMYHWRPDPSDGDEWVSSTALMHNMEREKVVIADLDKPGSFVVVAQGGRGGTGNSSIAKRQFNPGLLSLASSRAGGKPGEAAHLELELKLIADLGLVGFPNAGKSSLLAAMSMAKPEIAPYPFTTLHPLVGTIRYRDGFRVVAADVPGLIGGASTGRGRGHDFLRHLERTKALLYIVDAAGVDGRDPLGDLQILVEEISSYGDGDMMRRPALLVANKMDLIVEEDEREKILFDVAVAAEEAGIAFHGDVLGISAGVTGEGLNPLSRAMRDVVVQGEANRVVSEA